MGFLDRKIDLDVAAAFDVDELLVASPPDEEVLGEVLLTGVRIEEAPAVAVVNFQPRFQARPPLPAAEFESPDHARRYAGLGQHHRRDVNKVTFVLHVRHQELDVRVR